MNYKSISDKVRRISLLLAHHAKSSHTGGALSMADLLTVLYSGKFIHVSPDTVDSSFRDRFILSKGHCCASLYATLAVNGFVDEGKLINGYGKNGSIFYTHASNRVNGVDLSTGSLGHGLPVALGMAYSCKSSKHSFKVYCLVGDGELDEGSNWEAILFAANHAVNNLCLIVDYNKIQSMGNVSDINDLSPLKEKFESFRWSVIEIDGHDYSQIESAYKQFREEKKYPTVIIANTIKGKGVSWMENELLWHYRNPNDEQLSKALEELK